MYQWAVLLVQIEVSEVLDKEPVRPVPDSRDYTPVSGIHDCKIQIYKLVPHGYAQKQYIIRRDQSNDSPTPEVCQTELLTIQLLQDTLRDQVSAQHEKYIYPCITGLEWLDSEVESHHTYDCDASDTVQGIISLCVIGFLVFERLSLFLIIFLKLCIPDRGLLALIKLIDLCKLASRSRHGRKKIFFNLLILFEQQIQKGEQARECEELEINYTFSLKLRKDKIFGLFF